MNIRKYQVSDKEYLREICLQTSSYKDTPKNRALLNLLYNDYYTEQEKENCFVLVNDEDIAVGYIIGSENYESYEKTFRAEYLPKLKKLSFLQYIIKSIGLRLERKYARLYPAHLHIDILKEYTGGGNGTKLISDFCARLSSIGVKGVMLGVGTNNTKAQRFYRKNDFTVIKKTPFVIFMAKSLS